MPKNAPKVIEFVEPGSGAGAVSGKKRARYETSVDDVEKDAYLRGSASMVMAAATGRLKSAESGPKRPRVADDKKIQVDFNDVFKSVTSLGASSFTGKDKKVWEAKQLNALGANIKHKEKMPFKMYLGVAKARKNREDKRILNEKISGVVSGKFVAKKKRHEHKSFGPSGQPDSLVPDNIRGPVMFVKR